jgi:RNA polymerase sigma-70 factor (ECF subfamily)
VPKDTGENPALHDAGLVDAVRQGDRASFGLLYHRYARMVHAVLLARLPSREVGDLVQDVFVQALERLHTLRDGRAFGAWIATIARNRAADHYRHARPAEEIDDTVPAPESHHEEALAVMGMLRTLPDAYRETLTMRLVEGMTGPEIAERTGLTPESVRVNLHRGMKLLREKLEGVKRE